MSLTSPLRSMALATTFISPGTVDGQDLPDVVGGGLLLAHRESPRRCCCGPGWPEPLPLLMPSLWPIHTPAIAIDGDGADAVGLQAVPDAPAGRLLQIIGLAAVAADLARVPPKSWPACHGSWPPASAHPCRPPARDIVERQLETAFRGPVAHPLAAIGGRHAAPGGVPITRGPDAVGILTDPGSHSR